MSRSFEEDLGAEHESAGPPDLSVEAYDPEIIGVILGPDGTLLHAVAEPRPFPFGFSKGS